MAAKYFAHNAIIRNAFLTMKQNGLNAYAVLNAMGDFGLVVERRH